jgi:hypothetical protein
MNEKYVFINWLVFQDFPNPFKLNLLYIVIVIYEKVETTY